jgi:hypothetical protein
MEKVSPKGTTHRVRYVQIGRFANRATELLKADPHKPLGDLAEELKQWGADNDIPYFDAWTGAATPVQQAITIAIERTKTARAT